MLTIYSTYNYSSVLSMLYFVNYSAAFIMLFITVGTYLNINNNIYAITYFLKYSRCRYQFFVLSYIALLGVPPFSLFAPKFAALSSSCLLVGVFYSCLPYCRYLQVSPSICRCLIFYLKQS